MVDQIIVSAWMESLRFPKRWQMIFQPILASRRWQKTIYNPIITADLLVKANQALDHSSGLIQNSSSNSFGG